MRFQNGFDKVPFDLWVVQFWSVITSMISDQIALHSGQLSLFIAQAVLTITQLLHYMTE